MVLQSLVGESIETISVNSLSAEDAPFLGRIVSKLSPIIGNLLEARIIQVLDEEAEAGFSWQRQDPGFPDAILLGPDGKPTGSGFEVKAWFVHSTELTGRFRESVRLLEPRDVRVLVIAWSMSNIVYGTPKILGVLTTSGIEVARSRDLHYWNPPHYVTSEPGDTSLRTANLQQSNVSGFKLQASDPVVISQAEDLVARTPIGSAQPHEPAAQSLAAALRSSFDYRLDTNFAKIDRIDNDAIEGFKRAVLGLEHEGRRVHAWTQLLRDLNSEVGSAREVGAAKIISAIYDQL